MTRKAFILILLFTLALTSALALTAQADDPPRRVNAPYTSGDVDWTQTAIFWFGQNSQDYPTGQNYVDVRTAYTDEGLRFRVTVIDYALWYKENATANDDLSQYDAVSIFIDAGNDKSANPQTSDYFFFLGSRYDPKPNTPAYHRQGRGDGATWDTTWSGVFTDYTAMEWSCNPGPNNNAPGCIDYGWTGIYTIPWTSLGLNAPPPQGTTWGLGVALYDRDDNPPNGSVPLTFWPETFDLNSPATWGDLHFGYANYTPPNISPAGSTMIRAATPEDNTVEDAWMGGGGICGGGHEGGSEVNHGNDTGLYTGSETASTHFPCYNKSYLRFNLDDVPAGKSIISATLTLHLWGHAGETPDLAYPSWIHLFTVTDPWDEMTIHWNNAPLAQENVSARWVNPYSSPGNIQWPGDPYSWDATQAVAEAYAAGEAVNIALYASDKDQHSSKYFTASETGLGDGTPNWNIEGRPRLDIVWGENEAPPVPNLSKQAQPLIVNTGESIAYTLSWEGTGRAMTMTDSLPAGLGTPTSLNASSGTVSYNPGNRQIRWTGSPASQQTVTVSFSAMAQISGPQTLQNTAHLTSAGASPVSDSVSVLVGGEFIYLPLVLK